MPGKKTDKTHDTTESLAGSDREQPIVSESSVRGRGFPVVGIGASAGGLEALKAFFAKVPENSGMAYLVVVHMAPKQPSMMPELLQRVTRVPVATARDGEIVKPDRVYVVPPDKDLSLYEGAIQLMDLVPRGGTLPIDFFLRSLAKDQQAGSVAVILSGTGTDGTLGVKEIKACEGLVLVQSEESAGYGGMPASAIGTGVADMVLAPEDMPEKLVQYFEHLHTVSRKTVSQVAQEPRDWLSKVYALLRTQVGHDFSLYKKNTIVRRITRRMGLNQISDHELYIRFMRENPREAHALFRELLIGVTSFFRDAESFETLKKDILPGMFAQLDHDATFRVWVPGCSTGEEAYSLAMIFRECLDAVPRRITLQLFGTDIDRVAIDKAREGGFPESIAADVSPERLNRFFVKEGPLYRIRKEIRDTIVFSVQDVLKDPPFSRLNLLCCRNLLIYLDARAQKKLLPLFHYTLVPGGLLVLGSSESVGEFTSLFHTLDNKWKIFRRRDVPQGLLQPVEFPSGLAKTDAAPEIASTGPQKGLNIAQLAQQEILDRFSPPAILVDDKGTILHVVGRTGKYLEPASGSPTLNVLNMAREGLRIELSSALRAAVSSKEQVTRRRVHVRTNGDVQPIDLHVCPLKTRELSGQFLIVFEDVAEPLYSGEVREHGEEVPVNERDARISELEKELQSTRESHQTTIEELESSNEELKSTCEELQSSNEELQSTNEEMESSKEELQSVNEELQTVNAELQSKLEELSTAHDDMRNLLNSTEIATVFVDNEMRVKRFTQEATTLINLIGTDIGRPLQHVVTNLSYEHMIHDLAVVLKKLVPKETEVQTVGGKWYSMRIMPYRTTDNRIDGAVMTFTNIDDQKKAQQSLKGLNLEIEQARMLVRTVFDMNPNPLAVVDRQGKLVIANRAFCGLMGIAEDQVSGCDLFDLEKGALNRPDLRSALEEGEDFHALIFEMDRPKGKMSLRAHGQKVGHDPRLPGRILLHFEETPAKENQDGE